MLLSLHQNSQGQMYFGNSAECKATLHNIGLFPHWWFDKIHQWWFDKNLKHLKRAYRVDRENYFLCLESPRLVDAIKKKNKQYWFFKRHGYETLHHKMCLKLGQNQVRLKSVLTVFNGASVPRN